jgi:hypothetical protein
MSQRILLGYDGRREACDALSLAVILAEALAATLVVAKVCPEVTAHSRFSSYEEALGQASAGVLGDAERLLRRQSPVWSSRNEPSAAGVPPRASGGSQHSHAPLQEHPQTAAPFTRASTDGTRRWR